jgi:hypothetical protein
MDRGLNEGFRTESKKAVIETKHAAPDHLRFFGFDQNLKKSHLKLQAVFLPFCCIKKGKYFPLLHFLLAASTNSAQAPKKQKNQAPFKTIFSVRFSTQKNHGSEF